MRVKEKLNDQNPAAVSGLLTLPRPIYPDQFTNTGLEKDWDME